jgi:Cof subfamily protein (haloacid dehalogenase superfamily)
LNAVITLKEHCRTANFKGLFVVDLDGTLLTSERKIATEDLNALIRLREKNYLVAIATGRSNYSFELLIAKLGYSGSASSLPFDYVIFSTGAGIMDFPGNKLLKSFSLSPEDVRCAANYLEMSGLDYMIHRPIPDTRHFLYSRNGGNNPDFNRRMEIYKDYATPLSPEILENCGGATEVLCIVSADRGHEVAVEIADTLKQCSVIKATSPFDGKSIWIEIFAPTVSKSRAVKWLADAVGLVKNNICAVGNDYNDEDLLHWAGHGFIVANGPPSLKALLQSVASNDNGGVCEAVDRWLIAIKSQ